VQGDDNRKAEDGRNIPGYMDPVTAIKPMEGKGMKGILNCRSSLGYKNKGD
jgi:hypothetical protein